ncbi:MAG TPA: TetR/AcrR family transcriptional regulator [Anaerolineae bacterium]|nr:TetR/AcrR family transcriptional regulator [Anaerolineae bacterium]
MNKEKILEAAAQIISEKGYHAASMRDIAQAVHLQKPSLYHHISSKQEILFVLLNQALDMLIQRIEEIVSKPLAPEVKLRLAMETYIQSLIDKRDLAAVLLMEHRSLNPELNAKHIPKRDRFEQLWRDMIEEGVNCGVFSCRDVSLAAKAVLGMMNWSITWVRSNGRLSPIEIADQFADLILTGLVARSESLNQ